MKETSLVVHMLQTIESKNAEILELKLKQNELINENDKGKLQA